MSPCRVKQQENILKTGKFSVPAEMRRSTMQPGLAAAESSKPELHYDILIGNVPHNTELSKKQEKNVEKLLTLTPSNAKHMRYPYLKSC